MKYATVDDGARFILPFDRGPPMAKLDIGNTYSVTYLLIADDRHLLITIKFGTASSYN